MGMKVVFEAHTARDLFKQIADFIEVGATPGKAPAPVVVVAPAREVVKETETVLPAEAPAENPSTTTQPTPAVLAQLEEAGIPEGEWSRIRRTGKEGRMTQGDVKKYAAKRGGYQAPVEEAAAVSAGEGELPSMDDMKAALQSVYDHAETTDRGAGRTVCFSLLARHGAKTLPQVPDAQRTMFISEAEAYVSGTSNPESAA